jgi:hypothetical protein
MQRARAAVMAAFGASGGGAALTASGARRGRPPGKIAAGSDGIRPRKRRKKAPIQMCPVPNCKNRAAPIFGMVCTKHKDLPKTQIRKYREARRQKKLKAG